MTMDIGISTTYWVKGAFSGSCYVPSKMEYWSAGVLSSKSGKNHIDCSSSFKPITPQPHSSITPIAKRSGANSCLLKHSFPSDI